MKTQIAAIEFGTSKIVTVVAQSGGAARCDILGTGCVPYAGFKDGDWNDPSSLLDAIRDSVAAAELEAGTRITELYVGIPGEFIHVHTGEAEVELGQTGEATGDDMDAVLDLIADKLHLDESGEYILHRSPAWFSVDDGRKTMEPTGMRGTRLRASASFIAASTDLIDDLCEVLGALGLIVNGFLSPTLGMAILMLGMEERDRVTMLVDVGYLSTEVSVIEGDAIVYHAILGEGGGNITADLAYGLRLSMDEAEQIKRAYLFNPDEFDQDNFYEVYTEQGARMAFPRANVARIIEHRAGELCDLIRQVLEQDAVRYFGPRSQVQLTGGGLAMMRGGREFMASRLERTVKVPTAKSARLTSPCYSSVLGLTSLIFDCLEQTDVPGEGGFGKKLTGLFHKA